MVATASGTLLFYHTSLYQLSLLFIEIYASIFHVMGSGKACDTCIVLGHGFKPH